ncbi:MAG: hypothetical protein WDO15_07240 [Bacteroidota bacterium]
MNYTFALKNQYAYKMEVSIKIGTTLATNAWQRTPTLIRAFILSCVKGSNNDGLWNESGRRLKITIIPPFWMTWWFQMVVIFSFAGSCYVGDRIQVQKNSETE